MIQKIPKFKILFNTAEASGRVENVKTKNDWFGYVTKIATLIAVTLNLTGSMPNIDKVNDATRLKSGNATEELTQKTKKLPIQTFYALEKRLSEIDAKSTNSQLVIKRVLNSVKGMDPVGVRNILEQTPTPAQALQYLGDLRTKAYGVKSPNDLAKDFQQIGEAAQKGLLKIPGYIADYMFNYRTIFSPDTAPGIDVEEKKLVSGENATLERYTKLKFLRSVYLLKSEDIILTLQDGSTVINMPLLEQKISQRTLGVEYVKMLQSIPTGPEETVKGTTVKIPSPSLWDVIRENDAGGSTLPLLGSMLAEQKNSWDGKSAGPVRVSGTEPPLPNVRVESVYNDKDYLALENFEKSLRDQFQQLDFLIPMEELRDLSQKAGVKFTIKYRPESFTMEGAAATNDAPRLDIKTGEIFVTIRDSMKNKSTNIYTTRDNEDTEAKLKIKLVLQSIIEARKNNPDILPGTPQFIQLIKDVLDANPSQIVSSSSFQLFTLNRDRINDIVGRDSKYMFALISQRDTTGERILRNFPEIKLAAKNREIKNFASLSPDQQKDIWNWAKNDPVFKSYDPNNIAKEVSRFMRHTGKLDEFVVDMAKLTDAQTLEKIISGEITQFVDLPGDAQMAVNRYMIYLDPEHYAKELNKNSVKLFSELNDPTSGLHNAYSEQATGKQDINWEDPEEVQRFIKIINDIASSDGRPVIYMQNPEYFAGSNLPPYIARAKTVEELKNQPLAWQVYNATQTVKSAMFDTSKAINKTLESKVKLSPARSNPQK